MSSGNSGDKLLVKDGTLVLSDEVVEGVDILCEDGVVQAIGRGLSPRGADVIEARGMLVMPGFVDEHVHFREPGLEHKEGFERGSLAAIAGGVTTVIDMPNTLPPVDSVSRLRSKIRALEGKSYVDYALYGLLSDSSVGELAEMWEEGACGFKAFLGPTTGDLPPPSEGTIIEALRMSASKGFVIAFHPENKQLVEYYSRLAASKGSEPRLHSEARPPICEVEAVSRVALYSRFTGGRALLVHLSCRESMEVVRRAKEAGANIYAETCPHYLYLDSSAYSKWGCLVKVNPPLREKSDREALWAAIREGVIDTVGSDHAPHTREEKLKENVWEAAAGFVGVETLGPLMVDAALSGRISLTDLVRVLSENPARLFGLYPRKGGLRPGSDADLVIVDPHSTTTVRSSGLHSKHPLTPFEGLELKGRIRWVVLRGRIMVDNGKVVGGKSGRFIARQHASNRP